MLVANAETSTVLHGQAHKAAAYSAETEVYSSDDDKLGLHLDPRRDKGVGFVPLHGKPAGRALVVLYMYSCNPT